MEEAVRRQTAHNRERRAFLAVEQHPDLSPDALVVLATVPAWWERRAKEAGLRSAAGLDVGQAVDTASPFDIDDLIGIPLRPDLLDASPEAMADAYVCALAKDVRSAAGRHYTPTLLAEVLHGQAIDQLGTIPDGLVWDPAAGAGMLLLPALRSWLAEHRDAQADLIIAGVTSAVGGRDTDAAAVWLGSILLAASLLPIWAQITSARRRPLPALLSFGDGLEPPPVPPQVTILNPPYGRVRLTTQDRRRWDHAVYGHANRYGLFMAAAVDYSAPGGVVSALVPAGWLGGAYFQRLRAHLARTAPLMHLTYVTDRRGVFSTDVLQETVIATFQKGGTARGVVCARLNVNGETVLSSIGAGSVPECSDLPWLLPRSADDLRVVEAISSMPHRLSYYGWRASTGPLVWNRHKSQLSAVPERGSVRIIWAADIDGGVLHEDPARAAMRWVAPRTPAEERTLVLSDPAVLVQRTTAPEQGRRIVVTTLDESALRQHGGRVVVENHVNVLTCANPTSVLTPDLLARLLGSRALDRVYRCITGSVATSAYELAAIPLPRPEILAEWVGLPLDALNRKIDEAYGLAP